MEPQRKMNIEMPSDRYRRTICEAIEKERQAVVETDALEKSSKVKAREATREELKWKAESAISQARLSGLLQLLADWDKTHEGAET